VRVDEFKVHQATTMILKIAHLSLSVFRERKRLMLNEEML
jgi:hypothetical protein